MAKDLEKLQQILKRYTYAKDRWDDVYQLARDDRNFLIPGGQWDDATRHDRENDPTGSRPCLESPALSSTSDRWSMMHAKTLRLSAFDPRRKAAHKKLPKSSTISSGQIRMLRGLIRLMTSR